MFGWKPSQGALLPMTIAICDDIPAAVAQLRFQLETIGAKKDLYINFKCFNSVSSMLKTDFSDIQVVFLDIDMPDINGLDAAKILRKVSEDLIIVFVTAFIDYAPAGYRVSAFRYLLKQNLSEELPIVLDEVCRKLTESSMYIPVQTKDRTYDIALKNIVYIEGTAERKVHFHLYHETSPLEVSGRLQTYEKLLNEKGFLRLQRSFLANMSHILKISGYQVYLSTGITLKASEKYYSSVQASFLRWKSNHI